VSEENVPCDETITLGRQHRMQHSLWQPRVLWCRPIKLTTAGALLSGMLQFAPGQSPPLAPATFLWGAASNTTLSLTFVVAERRHLFALGVARQAGTGEWTALAGAGVRFNTANTKTSLLIEGLVEGDGWAGRLAVVTRSELGQASAFGRVSLTHALGPKGDPPEIEGTLALHGRLGPSLRWGTAYQFDLKTYKEGEHRLGPSLEVRLPRARIRVDFGHGIGRAADEWTVSLLVGG